MNGLKVTLLMIGLVALFMFVGFLLGGQRGMILAFILASAMNAIITNSLDQKEDMEQFFGNYVKTNPLVKETVEKSFETVEIKLKTKAWLST